jgi:hypothetical protein
VLVVVGLILVFGALGYLCWKRRGGQPVEFEVFANEQSAPTTKESKDSMSGTGEVITIEPKDPHKVTDE